MAGGDVAEDEPKTIGEDGLFKLLSWNSAAIPKIFGLPDIVGEPIQQEFQHPLQRRVDRLYRLADGSLLNIEHQSRLDDREALARRMIDYRNMIRARFPSVQLRQVVAYTGREPLDRGRIGRLLNYEDSDEHGRGVSFRAELRDFRATPVDAFKRSGRVDDLILGLMAAGGDNSDYIEAVVGRIRSFQGENRRSAIEKFIAVCATMPDVTAAAKVGDLRMWIEEVKDSPFIREIVEIAGKERIEEAMKAAAARGVEIGKSEGVEIGKAEGVRLGLARSVVHYAVKHKLDLPGPAEEVARLLAAGAAERLLYDMIGDLERMSDFGEFIMSHGAAVPRPQ